MTTDERRRQQLNYSQPMSDGRRALMIRWHQTVIIHICTRTNIRSFACVMHDHIFCCLTLQEKEKEELKALREASKVKQRNMLQRKKDLRNIQTQIDVQALERGQVNI